MCGRYALHSSPEVVALQFGLEHPPEFAPRYNIAPTSVVPVVRIGDSGARGATPVRWGLVPHWAKDASIGARMNNARAETASVKPSFRDAYRRRRCLIPANGFYEWKPEGGIKQPFYIRPAVGALFGFAGLWERWIGPDGALETCAILTTDANRTMQPIHERMPVILAPRDYARWLEHRPANDVADLLAPCDPAAIVAVRVSRAVSNARNESPELITPLAA